MDKFKALVSKCAASVELSVNEHKDIYQSVSEFISDDDKEDIKPEVLAKMIELNTVVSMHFYPHTPVGFIKIFHYDIDMAIDEALKEFDNEQTT
mgnify:CR=1 FL=1